VVTVIVALPAPGKLTFPLEMVATPGWSELHATFLFVALLGSIVAVSVTAESPTCLESVVGFTCTPVTEDE
jgi:hypothetical protein